MWYACALNRRRRARNTDAVSYYTGDHKKYMRLAAELLYNTHHCVTGHGAAASFEQWLEQQQWSRQLAPDS